MKSCTVRDGDGDGFVVARASMYVTLKPLPDNGSDLACYTPAKARKLGAALIKIAGEKEKAWPSKRSSRRG